MCFRNIITVMLACALTACGAQKKKNVETATISMVGSTTVATTAIGPKDTVIVDSRAAVYLWPDSMQIVKAKQEGTEEDFYTVADDALWYMAHAREFFDSVKLKGIYVEGKKVLKFKKDNDRSVYVNLDTVQGLWGIYFFDPAKEPYDVNFPMPQDEYKKYFE